MDTTLKAIQAALAMLELATALGVNTSRLLAIKAQADAEGRPISQDDLKQLAVETDAARDEALKA